MMPSLIARTMGLLLPALMLCRFGNAQEVTERPSGLRDYLELSLLVGNVYESNIDHNDAPVSSYGLVPGLRVRLQNRRDDPLLTAVYIVARHDYTNTDKWDRVSHKMVGLFTPEFTHWLHAETSAELSLKGSSEDRDISDQFQVGQELELRLTRNHRFYLYGTLRWKRVPGSPLDDAFKPNVGAEFERRLPGGRRFEAGARYEQNREELARGVYDRWTYEAAYRFPIVGLGGILEFGAEYRRKTYADRFVEIEDADVLRRDHRWGLGVAWDRTFFRHVHLTLDYVFETRDSNDPDKHYTAHQAGLSLAYRI